jgi:hypothetical protein
MDITFITIICMVIIFIISICILTGFMASLARLVMSIFYIYLVNMLLLPFNIYIGLNYFTVIITAILGLPGLILLHVTNIILRA